MSAVSIPCGLCPGTIAIGMAVCPACQRPVTDQDRAVLQVRLEGADFQSHERGRRIREGSKWIGVLAVLYAVWTPMQFALTTMETDKALANLGDADDDEELATVGGQVQTAGDVRKFLARAPRKVLIVNGIVAGLMGVLWFWARRAPLPAIACALALYVVLQLMSALLDPSELFKGIIIKLLALGALAKGFKAALAARAAMQRPLA